MQSDHQYNWGLMKMFLKQSHFQSTLLNICEEKETEMSPSPDRDSNYEFLRLECIETRERLSEMDRALTSLQSENERLRTETERLKECSTDSLKSVDQEVQDVTCVR